ncbi:hypothetical protein HDU96_003108 [Phlyctochytrium bullatum]|nr:hypothetical protein HDU96_003108 [Phlyctochytrium bullatum]
MEVDLEGEAHGDQAPPRPRRRRQAREPQAYRSTYKLGRLRFSNKWTQYYKPADPIQDHQNHPPRVHRGYDERLGDIRNNIPGRGVYKFAPRNLLHKTRKVVRQAHDLEYKRQGQPEEGIHRRKGRQNLEARLRKEGGHLWRMEKDLRKVE